MHFKFIPPVKPIGRWLLPFRPRRLFFFPPARLSLGPLVGRRPKPRAPAVGAVPDRGHDGAGLRDDRGARGFFFFSFFFGVLWWSKPFWDPILVGG